MRRTLSTLGLTLLAALLLSGTVYSRNLDTAGAAPGPGIGAGAAAEQAPRGELSACGGAAISEEDAHRAVWALPEVTEVAERLRAQGVRPFTMTASSPETGDSGYRIYFGEDHGTHTVRIATYRVDARSGQAIADPGPGDLTAD